MPKFLLNIKNTGQAERDIHLTRKPLTIGRHPDNDLVVDDALASRFHCIVEPATDQQDRYRLRDLGSRNGTTLNGDPVEEMLLSEGDVIAVGQWNMRFKVETSVFDHRHSARNQATIDTENDSTSWGTQTGKGKNADPANSPWALEFGSLIERLPPKSTAHEQVILIDASGNKSTALMTEAAGPVAVRLLLLTAAKARATDIHIEPKGEMAIVRMRIDGQMITIVELPNDVNASINNLLRTACHLNASGRDALLDGSFAARLRQRRIDYRVSLTPSVHGQKIVLRALDQQALPARIEELGLPPYMLQKVQSQCLKDAGMVLACGPTGSGKTTTLYTAMRTIDREQRNVITIEDPVEYHLEGVTQIPVNDEHGKGFSSLLRSVLRQDPDVILLGEIRDNDTARTAMQAAMTGHLVFSTVHAKDTIGAVFRLLDLGVAPYLIANSLDLIIAQRLVRTLCPECKQDVPLKPAQAKRMGKHGQGRSHVCAPVGCEACLKTGYRGRHALFEALEFNDELRDIVLNQPSIQAMKKALGHTLFTSLESSGWSLVAKGRTSVEEVERVISSG